MKLRKKMPAGPFFRHRHPSPLVEGPSPICIIFPPVKIEFSSNGKRYLRMVECTCAFLSLNHPINHEDTHRCHWEQWVIYTLEEAWDTSYVIWDQKVFIVQLYKCFKCELLLL